MYSLIACHLTKKSYLFLAFFLMNNLIHSQNYYAVYFMPKDLGACKLALSQESIDRKSKFKIKLDPLDYRIEDSRLEKLNAISTVEKYSNWLNCVVVLANEAELVKIKELPFVQKIELLKRSVSLKKSASKFETNYTIQDYGDGYQQINMHHGDILHRDGFQGQGMKIAVFDAGFPNVNEMRSFDHLFQEGRIFPVRNIVYNNANLYSADGHGTSVLGCMAAFLSDTIVGSAPKSSYYLFITEDARSESKLEEINWAIAAQMADSIGVDIINSSLGYHAFEDSTTNYSKNDMDGKTSISSKAASIACSKGILVVNSAGNLGNSPWRIISAPADVDEVISVGSINREGNVSSFSSRGFNANGGIKPSIVAIGEGTTINFSNGNYIRSNGTSFSSPVMAGLLACYWQKNRSWTSNDIRKSVYESADNYWKPNPDIGFGKVDFLKATNPIALPKDTLIIRIYPNPSSSSAIAEFMSDKEILDSEYQLYFFDKKIGSQKLVIKKGLNQLFIDLSGKSTGLYFLKIKMDNYFLSAKFEKN